MCGPSKPQAGGRLVDIIRTLALRHREKQAGGAQTGSAGSSGLQGQAMFNPSVRPMSAGSGAGMGSTLLTAKRRQSGTLLGG